jgi:hypothetical protein
VETFTLVHVLLSLVGLAAGFVVLGGMMARAKLGRWTLLFLGATAATSATGFGFPFVKFLPSHGFAIVTLVALAAAVYGLYVRQLAGVWRIVFVGAALLSQYLNFVVLIVQLFLKTPALHAVAPQQTEPPFLISQLVVLAMFGVLGIQAFSKFRPETFPAS